MIDSSALDTFKNKKMERESALAKGGTVIQPLEVKSTLKVKSQLG